MKYLVTKRFTKGLLAGLTVVEATSARFDVGRRYRGLLGSSSYVVLRVEDDRGTRPETPEVPSAGIATSDAKEDESCASSS